MADATYALIFRGDILLGFNREQVMERFGELFRLSTEEVERVFGHRRVVLKRNLDRVAADAFASRLAGIGMAVTLDAARPPAAPVVIPAARTTEPSAGRDGAEAQARIAEPAARASVSATAERISELTQEAISRPLDEPVAKAAEWTAEAGAQTVGAARTDSAAAPPATPTAPASPASPAAPMPDIRELPYEFTGNGAEFFRIWIVNLLLSIVTLGVYSAWAKVRTLRYFYGNTLSDGTSFQYLADPLKILKGRMIGFALLLLYSLASELAPPIGVLLMLGFLAIFPWIMVRGLAFRNHNSAWRGVRFGFDGSLGEAYRVFLLWPLLGVLTLGVLLPYALYRQQRFIIDSSRYGVEPFRFEARPASLYRIALAVLGAAAGGGVLSALAGAAFPPLGALAMVAVYPVILALSSVLFTNLRYNHTALGAHALAADYRLGSYLRLVFTNTFGIILTLGLFYPWAKVRNARYAAEHIRLVADGDLGEFAAAQRGQVSAVGGEIGDVFDVDLGL